MKRRIGAVLVPIAALAAMLLTVTSASGARSPVVAHPNLTTTQLAANVVPNLSSYTDLGSVAADKQMNVAIPLPHDTAAVASYEASLNDPSSPSYQQWLTPAEFQAKFDAPASNNRHGAGIRDPRRAAALQR